MGWANAQPLLGRNSVTILAIYTGYTVKFRRDENLCVSMRMTRQKKLLKFKISVVLLEQERAYRITSKGYTSITRSTGSFFDERAVGNDYSTPNHAHGKNCMLPVE